MGILLVFTLCVCLPRSFSQSVTQTPAAVTRKECQSLTINCVYYEGGFWDYEFRSGHFFRQTQTGTKRERISDGGRFVVSLNKAEKTFSLEIRDVKVEDTATYYCQAEYRYNTGDSAYGSGTVVTVTADSSSLVSRSPPLQTAAAGDTVTLSYEYSGFCQYTVHWYRQSPGQAPKYLLQIHTSGEQNNENAAGGRISASIDPTEKISRLKISKLQLSDSAVYYCELSRPKWLTLKYPLKWNIKPLSFINLLKRLRKGTKPDGPSGKDNGKPSRVDPIKLGQGNLQWITTYRPPSADESVLIHVEHQLEETVTVARAQCALWVGHFNVHQHDWLDSTTGRAGRVLKGIAARLGLRQVVREPTRGKNILDLVLTNLPECSNS
ncbi:uncharacterized protein [Heterodontus francisci]|uniref:uncharacterized protein n=1 Tax=Heterodontus francisci TaxID=7792 RepID=UPI00355C3500